MLAVIVLLGLLTVLLYYRTPLWAGSLCLLAWLAAARWLLPLTAPLWLLIACTAVIVVLNVTPLRRALISGPAFGLFRRMLPGMSDTEQQALDAGSVWWEGELFSGRPDWKKLIDLPAPHLTPAEQAFIDNQVDTLCAMLDDWKITHETRDLPPEVWSYIKEQGFLGLIIRREYGGLQFSNYAHAKVVTKIASRCGTAAVTVMVPNSLGPGELLQHYGTEEQKNFYLPRLAQGQDIPCFALTSPYAGSDAGAIPDFGVVCRGDYTDPHTGQKHSDVLGIRLTWEKRWITLAPVATVLGLAFKMYDPDHLLGDKEDIGITCALIPAHYNGVQIGRRHFPGGAAFMNGPTWGRNVFIPLDWIIGGRERAGQGWRMLMECLAAGRCISLPAMSVASGKLATYTSGAYARIRDQFGLPIGHFEGVDEALARIGGMTYQMEAAQDLALTGLDLGAKSAVLSAIIKYHNTERMRKTLNDAMDIHGGRTVVLGPRNYLARGYQSIPIGITVEGANILTRSMIIYGQGAIRAHPYVLREMLAARDNDVPGFDQALFGHLGYLCSNLVRTLWLGLTGARFSSVPEQAPPSCRRFYQNLNRASAAFALLSDMAMFSLGGSLKFREKLSARLGDMLSNLFIASASLKRYQLEGASADDRPLCQWAVSSCLYDLQLAMDGFLKNLPQRWLGWWLRRLIFPFGLSFNAPSDRLGTRVACLMMQPGAARDRLTKFMYVPSDEQDPVGVLAPALDAVRQTDPLERKLRKLAQQGHFKSLTAAERLNEALERGEITIKDYRALSRARDLKRSVIMVDDFDGVLRDFDADMLKRQVF